VAGNAPRHASTLVDNWETHLSIYAGRPNYCVGRDFNLQLRIDFPDIETNIIHSYISDVGAFDFKPLFITMGTVSVVFFDIAFIAERWLRHSGRLVHNTTKGQKILAAFSILFAIIGAAGLILLSIFDTNNHPHLHDAFLSLFM
jgi:hypothetical protein